MLAVTIGTSANAGSCSRENSCSCFDVPAVRNFSLAPPSPGKSTKSAKKQTQRKLTTDLPVSDPYTDPTFGTSLGTGVPPVGYPSSLHLANDPSESFDY